MSHSRTIAWLITASFVAALLGGISVVPAHAVRRPKLNKRGRKTPPASRNIRIVG